MQVASFDVFDTVLTRTFAAPRDVFVFLGQQLRERGLFTGTPEEFAQARWAAELRARKKSRQSKGVEEVMHEAIHAELAAAFGWNEAQSVAVREQELALEAAHVRAIPRLASRLAKARAKTGAPLWFISDMYLPAATLHGWLERIGVARSGDRTWVSGEAGVNKSSGLLFEKIRAETGASFAAWTHTGDHPQADLATPHTLGIDAQLEPAAHLTPAEAFVRGPGEFAPPWRSLLAGAMRRARLETAPAEARSEMLCTVGADVAGPLFFAFVRWCLAEAERCGKQRVYFLARDGQIFHRIAQLIRSPVECHYLLASRLAFSGARAVGDIVALRELLAPGGWAHSLRQTLAHAGLDETWGRANLPAEWRDSDWDANLTPDRRAKLADWLLQEPQRAVVETALRARTELAREYLAQEGVTANAPILLVDMGWAGSLQRSVEALLDGPADFAYLALMPGCAGRARGAMLDFAQGQWPIAEKRANSLCVLLELLAMADHPSLAGFRGGEGRVAPVLQAPAPGGYLDAERLQSAILSFVKYYLEVEPLAPAPMEKLRQLGLARAAQLHDRPTKAEASTLGQLSHADQWLEDERCTLCAPLGAGAALQALAQPRRRPPYWWIEGQAALTPAAAPALRAYAALRRLKWRAAARAHARGP